MQSMVDIALIIPSFSYAKLEEAGPACPHLGIAYIAAFLEEHKYSVLIIDARAELLSHSDISEKIDAIKPKIVGVTAVTAEFPEALALLKLVKKTDSAITTILGGPHATIMPETCKVNDIDYLVLGEGEVTMLELVDFLLKGKGKLEEINGIGYVKDAKLVLTPPRELIKDLDSLPFPAYHLLPMDKYRPYAIFDKGMKFTSLISSRGCPYMCTYCTSSQVFGKRWRTMSAKRVFELLQYLFDTFEIRHFYFQDDEFTIDKKRVMELCDLIVKSKMKGRIIWECLSRVSDVNDELLKSMYSAGCKGIVYGVEVGYEEGLQRIRKNITLNQALQAIKLTKKNKIHARASFMMGFPWESAEEIKKTIRFAKKLAPDIVYFQILIPYPGTALYEEMKRDNLIVSNDWDKYVQHSIVGTNPIIKTRHLSNKELLYWNARAFLAFYLSPRVMFKKVFSNRESGSNLNRMLITGYGIIKNSVDIVLKKKRN